MTDSQSFGAWLARERERRGISIRTIADRTKIGASHLEALERGNISRWPAGIYRRAFVKSYAAVVGLDADLVVANFDRAFPDPDAPASPPAPHAPGELRLLLAPASSVAGAAPSAWRAAGLHVAFALSAGLLGMVAAGVTGFWCAMALAALMAQVCSVLGFTGRILARTRAWRRGTGRVTGERREQEGTVPRYEGDALAADVDAAADHLLAARTSHG